MRLPPDSAAPARLLALFVLLAGLPVLVLGWLGWEMLEQERVLEQKRQRDRLENSANELADELVKLGTSTPDKLPSNVAWMRLDARGVVERRGVLLPYYPSVVSGDEPSAQIFASAELIEFQHGNLTEAARQYRELSRTNDSGVRAAALLRLARVLRQDGRIEDAIKVYDELTRLAAVRVSDAPAELVARRQRAAMLERAGNTAGTTAERATLTAVLSEGRYPLDGATFDHYAKNLRVSGTGSDLARIVEEWWPRWHAEPSGRSTWTVNQTGFATAWTSTADGTVAMAGYVKAGGLADEEATASRRNLLTVFTLTTLVLVSAGYFVFRAVQRELSVARLKSDFVSQVSHEFRTPLTAMRHLTDLLEEGGTPPERLPHFYQALGKETRRLHATVESLLDFGRIESGRQVYRFEETNLTDLAKRVVSGFSSPRIELQVPGDSPQVHVDRDALTLAVQNLVDNAMKYSPPSSPVRVSVETHGPRAAISVEDRGSGISRAEQRQVRRKFVRGSAAHAMNVKGTGIGLAIAEQVAQAHGGQLDVDSEPGRGSRFTISIPVAEHR